MDRVGPWARLVSCIEPHYFKGERERKPVGIERILRMYFLQQWYALADEALEDAPPAVGLERVTPLFRPF